MRDRRQRIRRAGSFDESTRQDRWLLSFADFVTLLLAVFILLAATAWQKRPFSEIPKALQSGFNPPPSASPTPAPPPPPPAAPAAATPPPPAVTPVESIKPADLRKDLQTEFGDSIDKEEIVLQERPDGLVIRLRELGLFRSGEANLLPEAAIKLQRIAEIVKKRGMDLRVEGHSDDQPIHSALYRSNWELSTARAMSVVILLVNETGFPPDMISAAGYGPYRPVTTNATPEGRRTNRRIDLVVTAPAPHQDPEPTPPAQPFQD